MLDERPFWNKETKQWEKTPTITEVKFVWVAWTNTDRTEGRGWEVPLCVAESLETATRIGQDGGVMGSACRVTEELAVRIYGNWLVPGTIVKESKEDKLEREKREAREAAVERAKAAGLSDDDIAMLQS